MAGVSMDPPQRSLEPGPQREHHAFADGGGDFWGARARSCAAPEHTGGQLAAGNATMRNDAFTLMEMMLALAVSAIALAGIGSVFYSAVHLRERTAAMLDEAGPLQHALQILRRDLQGAVPPGGSYSLAGDFKIQSASGEAGQQSLQLFSCTDAIGENAPWGDVQEIIYALRPATNAAQGAGMDLFRTVTRNLLATVVEPEDQWLLGKVQSLEVAGYD
ncbi:MAG: hypothetical protein DME25_18285, partial [Verrucomicrobia bacterium]